MDLRKSSMRKAARPKAHARGIACRGQPVQFCRRWNRLSGRASDAGAAPNPIEPAHVCPGGRKSNDARQVLECLEASRCHIEVSA